LVFQAQPGLRAKQNTLRPATRLNLKNGNSNRQMVNSAVFITALWRVKSDLASVVLAPASFPANRLNAANGSVRP